MRKGHVFTFVMMGWFLALGYGGRVWMISCNWVATLVYIRIAIIDRFFSWGTNSIAPARNRLQCWNSMADSCFITHA